MWTVKLVQDLVASKMESDLPDEVMKTLRQYDGKQLTKRILPKLPGGEAEWTIRQIANMTNLENKAYRLGHGNDPQGVCLLIAYRTKNITIICSDIEKLNPAYFDARKARNAKRLEVIGDHDRCGEMAAILNDFEKARVLLEAAGERLEHYTDFYGPFHPDRYTFKSIAEGKKNP
jgi:hypothetical protein